MGVGLKKAKKQKTNIGHTKPAKMEVSEIRLVEEPTVPNKSKGEAQQKRFLGAEVEQENRSGVWQVNVGCSKHGCSRYRKQKITRARIRVTGWHSTLRAAGWASTAFSFWC